MRLKCAATLGKPETSTPNWVARQQHQKKCASGAVKWSKKYSRPASKSSPIRKFSNRASVASLTTLSDEPGASQTLGGLLIRLRNGWMPLAHQACSDIACNWSHGSLGRIFALGKGRWTP